MMAKRAGKTMGGVKSIKKLERDARMTGGIATKILKTFKKEATKGVKKAKRPKQDDDSDDDGAMMQRHGRGADYKGRQRGNFANGRDLSELVKKGGKGHGFKSKAKYKRKR